MELFIILLIALVGLGIFDGLALELGVDSRAGSDDPHAPLFGSR